MKYVKPKYEHLKCETKDLITASTGFSINEDKENDKTEYVITPDTIFGF
ncbi:MAG: hypothetical protein IKA02_05370 [Clostridia bacterium]|nr:hypothetical protein [Clostridia bacterium]